MTTMHLPTDPTRTTSGVDDLRALLYDALSIAADHSPDSFDAGTPTGRTLLGLAALARQAAGALGAQPGMPVVSGPGVVVVRDFAAAVRLLDRAAASDRGAGDLDGVLAAAKSLHAQLHEAASTRR